MHAALLQLLQVSACSLVGRCWALPSSLLPRLPSHSFHSCQVLWVVGGVIEEKLTPGMQKFNPSLRALEVGASTTDIAHYPCFHPSCWRQTERELCRYTSASKRIFKDCPSLFVWWSPHLVVHLSQPSGRSDYYVARCSCIMRILGLLCTELRCSYGESLYFHLCSFSSRADDNTSRSVEQSCWFRLVGLSSCISRLLASRASSVSLGCVHFG